MRPYLDIVRNVLENGHWKGNRTGIRTLALPNQHFSHDMSEGYPLLTTKKMAFKIMAVELEGFIKGIIDKRWYQERCCKIWDSWCNPEQIPQEITYVDADGNETLEPIHGKEKLQWQQENPDLGKIYGSQWRNFNGDYKPLPFIYTVFDKIIEVENNEDGNVGKIISGKYGTYTIYKNCGRDENHMQLYGIWFHKTGYRKDNLQKQEILNGTIFDPYYPNVTDVACLGEYSHHTESLTQETVDKLKGSWKQMIHRCYNTKHPAYKNYGAKNIYVANRWLIFDNFLYDVQNLECWYEKLNNWALYQLDKDIKQCGYYGPNACLWVDKATNSNHTSQQYCFDAIAPNGTTYKNKLGLSRFCKRFGLTTKNVEASITNDSNTHNGWKFIRKKQYSTSHSNKGFDQFKYIIDTLRSNPNDRRMVCSAWNPNQLSRMALPACHLLWIVTVINGELNLHWTQRSCDLMLGVPFNIASYGLLMMLLCQHADLKPGNLSGMLCDCHIYENQLDGAEEQAARSPTALPWVEILGNDIYEWTHEDIKLHDYTPQDKINFGKVAV